VGSHGTFSGATSRFERFEDRCGPGLEGSVLGFCSNGFNWVDVEVESNGPGVGWVLAVWRMSGQCWVVRIERHGICWRSGKRSSRTLVHPTCDRQRLSADGRPISCPVQIAGVFVRGEYGVAAPVVVENAGHFDVTEIFQKEERLGRQLGAGPLRILSVGAGTAGDRLGAFITMEQGTCLLAFARATTGIDDVDVLAFDDAGTVLAMDQAADPGLHCSVPALSAQNLRHGENRGRIRNRRLAAAHVAPALSLQVATAFGPAQQARAGIQCGLHGRN